MDATHAHALTHALRRPRNQSPAPTRANAALPCQFHVRSSSVFPIAVLFRRCRYTEDGASAWVPFGVHKPHVFLPRRQLEQLYARCPPAKALAALMNDSARDGGLWSPHTSGDDARAHVVPTVAAPLSEHGSLPPPHAHAQAPAGAASLVTPSPTVRLYE